MNKYTKIKLNFYRKQFFKEVSAKASALKSLCISVVLWIVSDENSKIPAQDCLLLFVRNVFPVFLTVFICIILISIISAFNKKSFSPSFSIKRGITRINVFFGDIFSQEGIKVIPINDIADDKVAGNAISENSIHGQFLTTYCPGGASGFKHEIEKQTEDENLVKLEGFDGSVYKIGSIFRIDDFFCAVLTHTKLPEYTVKSSSSDLICVVESVIDAANQYARGKPVFMPLIGGGLARINLEKEAKVQMIISAIQAKNSIVGYNGEFNIVLSYEDLENIKFDKLKQFNGVVDE